MIFFYFRWHNKEKSISQRLLALGSSSLLVGNVMMTSGFLYIAHYNYPGGVALGVLHQIEETSPGLIFNNKVLTSIFYYTCKKNFDFVFRIFDTIFRIVFFFSCYGIVLAFVGSFSVVLISVLVARTSFFIL